MRPVHAITINAVVRRGRCAQCLEIGRSPQRAAGQVLRDAEREAEFAAGGQMPVAVVGQTERMHRDIGNELGSGAEHGDVVAEGAIVEAVNQLVIVAVADPVQKLVVMRTQHRAAAAHIEQVLHHAGIHIGIAGHQLEHVAIAVERNAITGAEDFYLIGLFRRGDELHGQHLISVEQVGMLVADAETIIAGLVCAAVVQADEKLLRIFIGHIEGDVDILFLCAVLEQQRDTLGRILIGHAQRGSKTPGMRRLTFGDRRQTVADVFGIVMLVGLDRHLGDIPLDHPDMDHPLFQFLLGQQNLDGGVALFLVGRLQGFQRVLHIGKILVLPREGRNALLDFFGLQQRITLDDKAGYFKARRAAVFGKCDAGE